MIEASDPVASEELADAPAEPATGVPAEATPERFPVETTVFSGELEELVRASHRGDVDLSGVSVSDITAAYRKKVDAAVRAGEEPDLRDVADFISLASRLIAEKAKVALPDDTPEIENF